MIDTFEIELKALIDQARADNMPFNELEAKVAELHHKHGREVPPPITGTIETIEPSDTASDQ